MRNRSIRNIFLLFGFVVLSVGFIGVIISAQAQQGNGIARSRSLIGSVGSLAPTSSIVATPTSSASSEAQKALAYIAQGEGIAIDNLVVANEFRRNAPLLKRTFQAVTVLEQPGGRFFDVLVDIESGQVEERATVESTEAQATNATYGKLQPALYERLQQLQDTDLVTVTLVVAAEPGQSLGEREVAARTALAAKYPEARAAIERHGKPMDVDDPALAAQIYKEYVALVDGDLPQRITPLVAALKAQGFTARTTPGFPAVTVTLPKQAIQALAKRDDVGTIFWERDAEAHPVLDTAIKTNRANIAYTHPA